MARISRVVASGYPHHVTQRGVRSIPIFQTDSDRRAYLDFVTEEFDRFGTTLARPNRYRSDDINSIKENTDEIHDQLVRTSARIADGVRECTEADPGGFHS